MNTLYISQIDEEPFETIPYLTVPANSFEPQKFQLPIYRGRLEGLPQNISAIVVASDLQGVVYEHEEAKLLGQVVAESLPLIFDIYFPEIDRKTVIALLCGDLYTELTKRGQSGNPIKVWQKFASTLGRVIGIAGNHDDFGNDADALNEIMDVDFLSNGSVEVEELRIAGLSGIIGRPEKTCRLPEADYLKALSKLLLQKPTILLTHLSPQIVEKNFQGNNKLTEILKKGPRTILFCGHSHWDTSQAHELATGTQILNSDSKVFVLTKQ